MDFLETLKQLTEKRPLSTEVVEDALGVALRADPDNTNPYVSIHVSFRVPAHIKRVEVRSPEVGATRKDALVIVDLDAEALGLGQSDVKKLFGDAPALEIPTPREPPESPVYLAYRESWGTVRFGFARPATDKLSTVVIDAGSKS